jgi:DNA invertase Pin-like site-specific DNA recombinase
MASSVSSATFRARLPTLARGRVGADERARLFTTDTPTAVLVRQVLGAISQFEKASLVAKLRAAREHKVAAGGRGSGRFAYAQKVPKVVALVRELHGQRQSLRQISKTLAAHGHLTGGGRPYTATAVQKMLRAL